jgi:hypothetical protein
MTERLKIESRERGFYPRPVTDGEGKPQTANN